MSRVLLLADEDAAAPGVTLDMAAEVAVASLNGSLELQRLGFSRIQADCYLLDPQQVTNAILQMFSDATNTCELQTAWPRPKNFFE